MELCMTKSKLYKNVTFEEGREFAKQITDDHSDVDGVVITDLVAVGF
jgi:LacI family transcriptional regulator